MEKKRRKFCDLEASRFMMISYGDKKLETENMSFFHKPKIPLN